MKSISTYFSSRRKECVSPFFDMNNEEIEEPTETETRFPSAAELSDISEDYPVYEPVFHPCVIHGSKISTFRQLPHFDNQKPDFNFDLKTNDALPNTCSHHAMLDANRSQVESKFSVVNGSAQNVRNCKTKEKMEADLQNSEASMKMQPSMAKSECLPSSSRFDATRQNTRVKDKERTNNDQYNRLNCEPSAVETHLKEHFSNPKIIKPICTKIQYKEIKPQKTNFVEKRRKYKEAVAEYQLEIYKNRYLNSKQNIFEDNNNQTLREAYCDLKLENIKIKTEKEWLRLEIDRMHDCFKNLCEKVEKLNAETKKVVTNITIRMDRAFEYVYRLKASIDQKKKWFNFKWR